MEEMDVATPNLKPGDVLVGAYLEGANRETHSKWHRQVVITKPQKDKDYSNYYTFEITTNHGSEKEWRLYDVIWIVERPSAQSKDFPHKCPRCGKNAYVGFLEVSHQFISDCPARAG